MHTAYFITGTDTGVGKTRTSTTVIHALRQAGHARVVGMKPVASGCDWVDEQGDVPGQWLNEDVAAMRAASSLSVPGGFDNPYALPDAVSPHIAARRAGVVIDLDHIKACFHALRQHAGLHHPEVELRPVTRRVEGLEDLAHPVVCQHLVGRARRQHLLQQQLQTKD